MKKKFQNWDEAMNLREVKTLRRLDHKNIVKLKEVIKMRDNVYLVFEYMKGTLLDHMRNCKRFRGANGLPSDQIKEIMTQVLNGLSYIHNRGFIHRDLKPENLLYQDGTVKIADFGLCKDYVRGQN